MIDIYSNVCGNSNPFWERHVTRVEQCIIFNNLVNDASVIARFYSIFIDWGKNKNIIFSYFV